MKIFKQIFVTLSALFAVIMSLVEAFFPLLESKIPVSVISVVRPINAFLFMVVIITGLNSSNSKKKYSKTQERIVLFAALFVLFGSAASFARTFTIFAVWQAVVMWWAIIGMLIFGKKKFFSTKHA